jgi:hypothetical protein
MIVRFADIRREFKMECGKALNYSDFCEGEMVQNSRGQWYCERCGDYN